MIKHGEPNARTVDQIVDAVEIAAGLPRGAICDINRRTHDVSLARHVAYYVARRETKLSFAVIARACGAVDHKGIMYGFNRVAVALTNDSPDDPILDVLAKVAPQLLTCRS